MRQVAFRFAALMVVMAGVGFWFSDYLAIDGCLDGGGAWDYEGGVCHFE
ncbi:hypothetical protein [Novosphingobium profundi]|nr:hypothetical protein [Novosphingobium profundi]